MNPISSLGRLLTVYRGHPLRWRELVVGYIPATLFAIGLLAVGVWRSYFGYTRYGPAAAIGWSRYWFLTSLFVTLATLILTIQRIIWSHRRIAIHENGFVISNFPFLQTTYFWRDISGIAVRSVQPQVFLLPLPLRIKAVIYPYHHRPISFDQGYQHLAGLISMIKERTYPRLLSNFIQDLNDGNWVHFGDLSVNSSSIRIRSRQFNLTEVHALKVLAGSLVVELCNGYHQSVPVFKVPNLELLFQLIKRQINR